MNQIQININGIELIGIAGQTILDVAKANHIEIPTLCHDERVKSYGACGVCVVEAENTPKLLRACSTVISAGMIIHTNTPRVIQSRQTALDLLLSDHTGDCRPPCVIACPGHTDCQGYVGLIGNGQFKEALQLIKEKIPMPASIGRVCPHPCEEACRREMVEEPISIAQLKSFVADIDLEGEESFLPSVKKSSGKKVAVIGGGPGGLSAAYFLTMQGHRATVYDAMPKMGGMLRYGIPEYRLPKHIVDEEVALIESIGVTMVNGVKVGKDISFDYIKEKHDAVLVAIGAWTSMKLGCPGEDLEGVVGGIDFLRDVAMNQPVLTGKKVAIVGGGNTAMDACRTAVRLGASQVYNIYRRTKDEMPAEEIEITEAEEEGVIFKYLTNPIEIKQKNGRVSKIRLQKMELGAPDASGRRAPVPIEGAEETLSLDTVIIAIGQGVDPKGFEFLDLSKRRTILADETTYMTSQPGVFAIGDATNKGASIAIEAIGDAKRAADVMDQYLNGETVPYNAPFIVTQDFTPDMLAAKPKISREKMPHLKPKDRNDNFAQVTLGYSAEQALKEAKRCLECGCADFFECKLIQYANEYEVKPEQYKGEIHNRPVDVSNPFMYRNPDKCILCGLCVRVCDEVMGRTALGLVDRGFDTVVKPALGLPLAETDCISCGQCIHVCPTGAIGELLSVNKSVPLEEECTETVCSYCSVGCRTKLTHKGNILLRSLPDDSANQQALLCVKGRFGFGELQKLPRLTTPLIRKHGNLSAVSMEEAFMFVSKKAQSIAAQYGTDALAVAISDKYTNEEIFIMKEYATKVLQTNNVFSFNGIQSGLKEVIGFDGSTNTFDELLTTDVIVLMADDIINSHTIAGIQIKKAVENGAKLILISQNATQADEWAAIRIKPSQTLQTLKEWISALIQMGKRPENADGFEDLQKWLSSETISNEVKEAAELYGRAKKAMFVFDQKRITADAAKLIGDIAVLSGHIGKARSGIIVLKENSNSQGLSDMGVNTDSQSLWNRIEKGSIKGLFIFGEDVPHLEPKGLDFLMVQDYILTETAEKADVVLPALASPETSGTYTRTDGRIQKVNQAVEPAFGLSNWELVQKLANVSACTMRYNDEQDILHAIGVNVAGYKNIECCDLSVQKQFTPVGKSPVRCSDGFDFADGRAKLQIPKGDQMFVSRDNANADNTHVAYRRFMNDLENKKLLRS